MTNVIPHFNNVQILADEHRPNLAWLFLNRPDKANALSYDHLHDIEQAALYFRETDVFQVVILAGRGKHFSAGADLSEGQTTTPADKPPSMVLRRRRMRIGQRAIEALLSVDQITVAAWQGAAMGGGACLTTACDFRVGAANCFMQYPEIDLGINLMWKSLPLIVNLVGPARAKRLVVGSERLEAATLLDWGILDELVDPSDLLPAATRMADRYLAKPPMAAQMIKQSVNQYANALNHAIMHMDVDQNLLNTLTEDRRIAATTYQTDKPRTFSGD